MEELVQSNKLCTNRYINDFAPIQETLKTLCVSVAFEVASIATLGGVQKSFDIPDRGLSWAEAELVDGENYKLTIYENVPESQVDGDYSAHVRVLEGTYSEMQALQKLHDCQEYWKAQDKMHLAVRLRSGDLPQDNFSAIASEMNLSLQKTQLSSTLKV